MSKFNRGLTWGLPMLWMVLALIAGFGQDHVAAAHYFGGACAFMLLPMFFHFMRNTYED